jgi:hypothetical protein
LVIQPFRETRTRGELRGEHATTFDQGIRWWLIEATAHDPPALNRSSRTWDRPLGKWIKGGKIAEGFVQD